MSNKKVYIIYKPGCPYSDRALRMLLWYNEQFPRSLDLYIYPEKDVSTIAKFCSSCGICSGETFPQVWIEDYTGLRKKYKLHECTGYIGGCNDLIALMNDLSLDWTLVPDRISVDWNLINNLYLKEDLLFDSYFENFFYLDPMWYNWM